MNRERESGNGKVTTGKGEPGSGNGKGEPGMGNREQGKEDYH